MQIGKVDRLYRLMASEIHNHAATSDISIHPLVIRCTEKQDIFIQNLLRARASTAAILDILHENFISTCKLIANDIQNCRQNYHQKQTTGFTRDGSTYAGSDQVRYHFFE